MFYILLFCAWAQDWVVNISSPHELPSGGAWIRPFPTPTGWKVFLGGSSMRGGDLQKEGDIWTATNIRVISDQEGSRYNDHGVKKCPDGTFLHAASYDEQQFNDSAHIFRYDKDFSILASEIWEEQSMDRQYNDPSLLCSRLSQGIASSTRGGPTDFGNHYFEVDDMGAKGELIVLEPYPRMNGGALIADDMAGRIYGLGMSHGQPLQINTYDADWTLLSEKTIELLSSETNKRAYWPQGVIRVGDYYLVTFMGRDDSWGDGDLGDVFLGIFDVDWNLKKEYQITHYEAGKAMRPWISRSEDMVLIAYDADLKFYIVELTLHLESFGLTDDDIDTGLDPTQWDAVFAQKNNQGCSCSHSTAPVWMMWLFLIPLWRREPSVV